MKNDPTLRRWFRKFNKQWFNNELRDDTVVYWETCNGQLAQSWTDNAGIPHITVDPCIGFSPRISKFKLLHEMAHHAKPRATHGKVFQDEMLRLAQAGAFRKLW